MKAAVKNSGFRFPDTHITVNLAPADLKKDGAGLDLPIALGVLAAKKIRENCRNPCRYLQENWPWTGPCGR